MNYESELTEQIIGAAIEVHREMGPGLLESDYIGCLCREFDLQGLNYQCEVLQPIVYKGKIIEPAYRIDIWVEERVILEIKAVEKLLPKHEAQLLTYLKFSKCPVGLLINFFEKRLIDGLRRMVLDPLNSSSTFEA